MNNREWLYSLDVADLSDWFDAEHVETEERALDGDTAPDNEDSRERLEADVRNFAEKSGWLYPMAGTRIVLEWLDRQAAITAEETSNAWEEYRDAAQREIAELTAERDKLQAQLYELTADCDMLENERDNLEAKCDGWKKHVMAIENAYSEALQWRERYREKFGKCIDYADAIHALMDDEGMA